MSSTRGVTPPSVRLLARQLDRRAEPTPRPLSARHGICTAITVVASLALAIATSATAASAQGMGGMGGGMRGGGMGGGRGGMGRMPGGGVQSPVDAIKDNLKENDPLKFLLDRKKPLDLSKAQKDTLERYRKEMEDAQRPVYKDMEKLAADMPRGRGGMGRGGMGGEGGMGGGMGGMGGGERGGGERGGGERGGGRGGRGGDENPDSTAGGRGGRGPGGPFREYADKLSDIQDAFRDRARAQLTESQRVKADSLQSVWLAEQRKKAEEKRDERRDRRGN